MITAAIIILAVLRLIFAAVAAVKLNKPRASPPPMEAVVRYHHPSGAALL